jgi:hypothetical protein
MTEETEKEIAKEQIRGLYIVGLLAILITIKWTAKLEPFTDTFLFYVIASWAIYSFCMVFGYSSNLPKALVIFFKEFAELFLWMSLVVSIGYFATISYFMFILFPYTVGLYLAFAISMAVVYYGKKRRQKKTYENQKS